ncbi:MAG: hypothetical protein GXX96_34195 [Planctomycetaceae bacterium]|nr:hypothetical protein [Planctomycetaceae bacterium]
MPKVSDGTKVRVDAKTAGAATVIQISLSAGEPLMTVQCEPKKGEVERLEVK